MAQHDDITSLGWTGILAGGVLTAAALGLYQDGRYRKKEFELLQSLVMTGVGEACAAAQRDGKMRNVQLSGESYTDEPLTSQAGAPAMAVLRRKLVKSEEYEWRNGSKIFERREVTDEHGQKHVKEVDTGRREQGEWIPHVRFREVEKNTVIAPTGVCFRQLGAVQSNWQLSATPQICLNLANFDVNRLLQCQPETATFESQEMVQGGVSVNVNVKSDSNGRPPRPANRVLGVETRERFLPVGQEVHALGDVVWRFRASIQGMQGGGGSLAVLQPSQVGPFGFAYGSRDDVLLKTAASLRESSNSAMICGGLGICSMAFGTIALLSASS
mmetsp:Transcript_27173/g.63766  ORF Transcript_27173/g.63766 Transcript_27173/m.63766 type:complete len:329 (-) Transcript_27173:25-1011(-)|eukprot:s129_g23.t1